MSTNIRIQKVCQYCRQTFVAKTTKTKFCSHTCNSRDYKKRIREEKVTTVILETNHQVLEKHYHFNSEADSHKSKLESLREWISIRDLSYIMGVSERTLFRSIKDEAFPKIKIGKRLLFNKQQVFKYFISKSENPCAEN